MLYIPAFALIFLIFDPKTSKCNNAELLGEARGCRVPEPLAGGLMPLERPAMNIISKSSKQLESCRTNKPGHDDLVEAYGIDKELRENQWKRTANLVVHVLAFPKATSLQRRRTSSRERIHNGQTFPWWDRLACNSLNTRWKEGQACNRLQTFLTHAPTAAAAPHPASCGKELTEESKLAIKWTIKPLQSSCKPAFAHREKCTPRGRACRTVGEQHVARRKCNGHYDRTMPGAADFAGRMETLVAWAGRVTKIHKFQRCDNCATSIFIAPAVAPGSSIPPYIWCCSMRYRLCNRGPCSKILSTLSLLANDRKNRHRIRSCIIAFPKANSKYNCPLLPIIHLWLSMHPWLAGWLCSRIVCRTTFSIASFDRFCKNSKSTLTAWIHDVAMLVSHLVSERIDRDD